MKQRAMRRKTKELTDKSKINELLSSQKVGYLGLFDEEGTFVVPLNFVWLDEKIYFHGSEQGRKIDAIQKDHRVCFTISQDLGTIADPVPANIGTAYRSVMVFGHVRRLNTLEESTAALQALLDKFVPGYFDANLASKHVDSYRSSLGSKTVVYCLEPDQITAKEDTVEGMELFYPGRKQQDDLKEKGN